MKFITSASRRLVFACLRQAVLIGIAAAPTIVRADKAVVVGVNEYPHLRPGSNLSGCVNDANRMAAALEKYHFSVTLLTNAQATRQNILNALAGLRAIGSGERVAFYFAGHGTHAANGASVLLPSDASDVSDANDLQTEALFQAIKAIPAQSKSVFLDSCHSGGMMRSLRGIQSLTSRYYQRSQLIAGLRQQGKAFEEVNVNKRDARGDQFPADSSHAPDSKTAPPVQEGNICYYTACMGNEIANETVLPDGNRGGIFTYHLLSRLNGKSDLWQNVSAAVNQQVADATHDLQHPALTPAFLHKIVFDASATGANPLTNSPENTAAHTSGNAASGGAGNVTLGAGKSDTLADIYSAVNPDASRLTLTMNPSQIPLAVGQGIRFDVHIGAAGYLVLLGRDPNDDIYVLYPRAGSEDDGRVDADTLVPIPQDPNKRLAPNTPGTERLKALFFSTRAAAQKLLTAMREVGGKERSAKRQSVLRRFSEVAVGEPVTFYTAELMVEIVPQSELNP